ncbi:MAG: threonine ammonia-lyase [Pseudomonadota bacterium]
MQNNSATTAFLKLEDIENAAKRIAGQVIRTSFRQAPRLSKKLGCDIYIKYENEQVSGAFKERGALNKLLLINDTERKAGVIAASAGNHAQGVAYHAGRLGIPSVIVMPSVTPMAKVEATRSFGAQIVLAGDTFDECQSEMYKIQKERGLTLIHPFNDLAVMAGQGTIGLEIDEQAEDDLDACVIAIGGGGLASGVSTALKAKRPDLKIYGVQTPLFPHFYNRRYADDPLSDLTEGATLAEGIAVKAPGDICFLTANPHLDDVLLADEKLIEQAISLLVTETKTVAEGAGATGLAGIMAYPDLFKGKKVGFILCGGNIDSRLLSAVLTRTLFHQGRLFTVKMTVNDRPGFLAQVSELIAKAGGNVIEVAHNRYNLGMLVKDTGLSLTIEARDNKHGAAIRQALIAEGFNLQL